MRLVELSLRNFRNYERLDLALPPSSTILYGDNAQGKSNLLEAIYYLATSRSFRAGADRELLSWGLAENPIGFTRIGAKAERSGEPFEVDVILREEPRKDDLGGTTLSKRVLLNETPKRAIDVVGAVLTVMFSPQDLDLVEGAPLLRRRYLDVTISQADPRYCRSLAHYNRVVLQRNSLLRAVRDRGGGSDQIPLWNQELIAAGAYVVARRVEAVRRLGAEARRFYHELSGGGDALSVGYKSTVLGATAPGEVSTVEEVASVMEARLAEVRAKELLLGVSLVGPHRDDLVFTLAGHDLSAYGSRGQQRLTALALKLAEAEHLHDQTGELPILLLDDVLSELDPSRRAHVLATIRPGQQVLFTTTEPEAFDSWRPAGATRLRVAGGKLLADAGTPGCADRVTRGRGDAER